MLDTAEFLVKVAILNFAIVKLWESALVKSFEILVMFCDKMISYDIDVS